MKFRSKKIIAVFCIILTATLVSATILPFFGEINATINVKQPIKIDGRDFDNPITYGIEGYPGIICDDTNHYITNDGNTPVSLYWDHIITPDDGGVEVIMNEYFYLGELEIRVFDGNNDPFWVSIEDNNDILLCEKEFINDNDDNAFHVYTWDLTLYEIPYNCDTFTIAFYSAVDPSGSTVRVDYVKLCDVMVDIGDEPSEIGHDLISWSPIIILGSTNCRSIDGGASLTITCVQQVHDFNGVFVINPGETIIFSICYELNQGYIGTYTVSSQLKLVD